MSTVSRTVTRKKQRNPLNVPILKCALLAGYLHGNTLIAPIRIVEEKAMVEIVVVERDMKEMGATLGTAVGGLAVAAVNADVDFMVGLGIRMDLVVDSPTCLITGIFNMFG